MHLGSSSLKLEKAISLWGNLGMDGFGWMARNAGEGIKTSTFFGPSTKFFVVVVCNRLYIHVTYIHMYIYIYTR